MICYDTLLPSGVGRLLDLRVTQRKSFPYPMDLIDLSLTHYYQKHSFKLIKALRYFQAIILKLKSFLFS